MASDGSEKKGYYRDITIPGDVLQDDRLSDGAKIMYGKIARLSYKDGYCWASNSFLDGTKTGRNASRLIAELKNSGYLSIENEGSKSRKIRICAVTSLVGAADSGPAAQSPEKQAEATSPNLARLDSCAANLANSGEVETTLLVVSDHNQERTSPNLAGLESLLRQFCHEFLANLANSGGATSPNLATEQLNLTLAAAAAPKFQDYKKAPPPSGESAGKALISPQEVKNALQSAGRALILPNAFYPKAASFMALHGLDDGYLQWVCRQTESRKPDSFDGMFFTLFFADDMAEKYAAARRASAPPPRPPPQAICPACGAPHPGSGGKCPSCGLPDDDINNQERIAYFRKLSGLPPEKREEYERRLEAILLGCGLEENDKYKYLISELEKEFDLETA